MAGPRDAGLYTLRVFGPCTDCAGKACGDNGCGEICGACSDGDYCSLEGTRVTGVQGDACDGAIQVNEYPFRGIYTIGDYSNDYEAADGQCGGLSVTPTVGRDMVLRFISEESAIYTIRTDLEGTTFFNVALYVATGCEDFAATCIAGADGNSNAIESVEVALQRDVPCFVFVDSVSPDETEPVRVEVVGPCLPECPVQQKCEDALCVDRPPGETCAVAIPLTLGESVSGARTMPPKSPTTTPFRRGRTETRRSSPNGEAHRTTRCIASRRWSRGATP